MTHPGQPGPPFPPHGAPQPGPPYPPQGVPQPGASGAPGPFGPPPPARRPGTARRIGGIAAAVVLAGGVAAAQFGGFGEPEVGDCIASEGTSSWETVDCDDESAQARVVSVVEEEVTESEFNDPGYWPCEESPVIQALWSGDLGGEGIVYCAEPV
ncbi:MAG TPA: hypothetical protein VER97_17005 [Geodermatophilus sp.]|nr:hypothetical protein [Geodermatophilus sp.]